MIYFSPLESIAVLADQDQGNNVRYCDWSLYIVRLSSILYFFDHLFTLGERSRNAMPSLYFSKILNLIYIKHHFNLSKSSDIWGK